MGRISLWLMDSNEASEWDVARLEVLEEGSEP